MFQLAESDEFTLLGSLKFSSDARNASFTEPSGTLGDPLDGMMQVDLPGDASGMFLEDIDALRHGEDVEVPVLPFSVTFSHLCSFSEQTPPADQFSCYLSPCVCVRLPWCVEGKEGKSCCHSETNSELF